MSPLLRRQAAYGIAYITPGMLVFLVFCIAPIFMTLFYSFTEEQNEALDELLASSDMLTDLTGDLTVSSQEARELLASLPVNLSPERRAVVRTACKLVGKVNYFWGGCALFLDNLRRNTQ